MDHSWLYGRDRPRDIRYLKRAGGAGGVPEKNPIKIVSNTYELIVKGCASPRLFTGDFNAPDTELADRTTVPRRSDDDGPVAAVG